MLIMIPAIPKAATAARTRTSTVPDDVTSSGSVNVLVPAAVAAFGIAGIIISIATLVSALLH